MPIQHLLAWLAVACSVFIASLSVMRFDSGLRIMLAISICLLLISLIILRPNIGVPGLFIYLAALGGTRRWLIPVLGWPQSDPLLLVCPAIVGLYFTRLLVRRQVHNGSWLSRALLWFIALMALGMANPLQGGLAVGIAGALFYLVPVLNYYLGRDTDSADLGVPFVRVVIGVALLAALYGLYQTWFGFSTSERQWLRLVRSDYSSLGVNGVTRAFSFATSAAEYDYFCALGIVVSWALFLRGYRAAVLGIPLLAMALFLESSRTSMVLCPAVCAVLWAVQSSRTATWLPRGLLACALAAAGLVWSLTHIQGMSFSKQTKGLVEHQTTGLLNPFDPNYSTVSIHVAGIQNGFFDAVKYPVGLGLGASTIAAVRYGGTAETAEVDLPNMFISLGWFGGLLYAAIIGRVLLTAFRVWHHVRTPAALATLGILLLTLGQWLNGGMYAVSALVWLNIGATDRAHQSLAQ